MKVRQGGGEVREFARCLRELVTLLDPGSGWYGTFCRSDPAGMRACLDGAEIPPWDVMESLLQDLAVLRGTAFAQRESVRAAALYSSSVAAHDRRPGGRRTLVERLPVLADELDRTGLDADWATLLWEVSSLPPAQLASAAAALRAAGRPGDCGRLLRQGVARPPGEIAGAAVALERAGRGVQAEALLDAFVRVRTPQDVARVAVGDPHRLVPRLLAVARAVSPARERDVVHALRVAGVAGAP